MRIPTYILALLLGAGAIVAQSGILESLIGVSLAEIQLFAIPFIILILARTRVLGVYVPTFVIVFGSLMVTAAVAFGYLNVRDNAQSFLVAHLRDDEFEMETRVLRDAINRTLKQRVKDGALSASRYHGSFRNHRELEKFFANTASLPFVVWGSSKWVNLSFRSPPPDADFIKPSFTSPWLSAFGLTLVTHIPTVGIAYRPHAATAEFLAVLMQAEALRAVASKEAEMQRELLLREAATSEAHWTSYAHRAYPLFELGNLYLSRALNADNYIEKGELKCAIEAYTRARKSLRKGDNPEILAAALNNRAVAHFLQAVLENKRELRKLVRRELRTAVSTLKQKNLFGVRFRAAKIARMNLKLIEARRKKAPRRQKALRRATAAGTKTVKDGRIRPKLGNPR